LKKILFVCTGNTCRSVMAEAFFNNLIADEGLSSKFKACSAGIANCNGAPASENTRQVMKENYQIDVSSHVSRIVTEEDINAACLILTMTFNHKEYLLARFPSANGKTFTLGEYIEKPDDNSQTAGSERRYDIPDPYGMSKDVYAYCAADIYQRIKKLIAGLLSKE
jgi:protein-tyrosine-phosphatase